MRLEVSFFVDPQTGRLHMSYLLDWPIWLPLPDCPQVEYSTDFVDDEARMQRIFNLHFEGWSAYLILELVDKSFEVCVRNRHLNDPAVQALLSCLDSRRRRLVLMHIYRALLAYDAGTPLPPQVRHYKVTTTTRQQLDDLVAVTVMWTLRSI